MKVKVKLTRIGLSLCVKKSRDGVAQLVSFSINLLGEMICSGLMKLLTIMS